jgi:hypothetical protein
MHVVVQDRGSQRYLRLCCLHVPPRAVCAEYASTLHNVLVGLESSSLALWKLVALAGGYLGLLLFTVYLASSEVRLPIVQYAKAPPPVSMSATQTGCSCGVEAPRHSQASKQPDSCCVLGCKAPSDCQLIGWVNRPSLC